MSEIDPMKVVLPTAKPPATTIFTTVGGVKLSSSTGAPCPSAARPAEAGATSERGNAIENTLQNAERGSGGVRGFGGGQTVHPDELLCRQVADQYPDHADRQ